MKALFFRIRCWIFRVTPTEELSCSYVPAKAYQDCIVNGRDYPSISDDSSEFLESPDPARYVIREENSLTGAVLRRQKSDKFASPLSAFFEGIRKPQIRETLRTKPRIISER